MSWDGIVVMGVSGCGKTTVGKQLALRLGWRFFDADDYHPAANVEKMRSGIPLADGDRWPWLRSLRSLLADSKNHGTHPVLACSALKEAYRRELLSCGGNFALVYLKGTYAEILARLQSRKDHFMPASLLRAQFDDLEDPRSAWVYDTGLPAPEIVQRITERLGMSSPA